jgi:hypothetical protein
MINETHQAAATQSLVDEMLSDLTLVQQWRRLQCVNQILKN